MFLENFAVRADNSLLVTSVKTQELWCVSAGLGSQQLRQLKDPQSPPGSRPADTSAKAAMNEGKFDVARVPDCGCALVI